MQTIQCYMQGYVLESQKDNPIFYIRTCYLKTWFIGYSHVLDPPSLLWAHGPRDNAFCWCNYIIIIPERYFLTTSLFIQMNLRAKFIHQSPHLRMMLMMCTMSTGSTTCMLSLKHR